MRHQKRSQRLSKPTGPRTATLRSLAIALIKHQRIKTTRPKAKLTQSFAEKLISLGKKNTLHSRRLAYRILNDRDAVNNLFSQIAPLFKQSSSGFSRIMRTSYRKGDGAEMAFLELTQKPAKIKPKEGKKEKPKKKTQAPEIVERPTTKAKTEEKIKPPKEKSRPVKELKPKKFLGGLRKLFKKERDSL